MNLYLYIDNGTWKAFEAESLPVKPERCPSYHYLCTDVINDGCRCDRFQSEYDYLISTLKSKALPVGNPEIILTMFNDQRLYTWPGKWERGYAVYILTLPNMEKIELHGTNSGKLYITPEDLFAQEKVQEVIKKAAMKSETSKKIQDETPQERIEKEAEGLSRIRVWPEQMRVTFKNGYIAGATAELQRYELERTEMYNKYNKVKEVLIELKPIAEAYPKYLNGMDGWNLLSEQYKSVIEKAKNLLNEKP
jgi:hypothetical protein